MPCLCVITSPWVGIETFMRRMPLDTPFRIFAPEELVVGDCQPPVRIHHEPGFLHDLQDEKLLKILQRERDPKVYRFEYEDRRLARRLFGQLLDDPALFIDAGEELLTGDQFVAYLESNPDWL